MKRIIYAEDVKKQIDEWLDCVGDVVIGKHLSYYGELLGCIEDSPTVEAVPVVHGEWIKGDLLFEGDTCSICNTRIYNTHGMNFCPNCGAKMKKEENDNE